MKWPFDTKVIRTPGNLGVPSINPMPSVPGEQFMRSIDPPPSGNGGGGGTNTTGDWPLKLVAVDTENVKVLLGTVSGFTPTDVNTNIDVSGADGTWTFYMHATISGTAVTAVAVENDGGAGTGVPADDGNNSYRLIGTVLVASSVISGDPSPAMAWSQTVITCTADSTPHDWLTGA